MEQLTHLNDKGQANMVDVTEKQVTTREAKARGYIKMSKQALTLIQQGNHKKGDVFAVARIAGIQAAKKCSDLIPLCHPLMLTKIDVEFDIDEAQQRVNVQTRCKLAGQTGVEMEALTACLVACLTLYDMCKAVDKTMEIGGIEVVAKSGGKSGDWQRT